MTPAEWLELQPLERPRGLTVFPRRLVELVDDVERGTYTWTDSKQAMQGRPSGAGESESFRL